MHELSIQETFRNLVGISEKLPFVVF